MPGAAFLVSAVCPVQVALTTCGKINDELMEATDYIFVRRERTLQSWVELISNSNWSECLLVVNNNLVTKGGCLVAAVAKSKRHTHIQSYSLCYKMATRNTGLETPERTLILTQLNQYVLH